MANEASQSTREVVETVLLDPEERRKLIAFARSRYGVPDEDAEDLLQETALELLRQRQYVHSPRGYLFVVFQKRCVRWLRVRKCEDDFSLRPERTIDSAIEQLGRERTDQGIAIRQALYRISSVCRKLLAARYVEGRSIRETAEALACRFSGLGSTIDRCLNRLKACLS